MFNLGNGKRGNRGKEKSYVQANFRPEIWQRADAASLLTIVIILFLFLFFEWIHVGRNKIGED